MNSNFYTGQNTKIMTDDNGTDYDCPGIAVPGQDETEVDHSTIQPAAPGPVAVVAKPAAARRSSLTQHADASDQKNDDNNNTLEAIPITTYLHTEHRETHRLIVDYGGAPFEVTWTGDKEYPSFDNFPNLDTGTIVSRMQQSPVMASLWKASTPVGFGSNASTRLDKSRDRFPIIKLAHPDEQSRRFLQHEFFILSRLMTVPDLPVVRIDPEPILDGDLLCGFRMEELDKMPIPEFFSRKESVEHALQQLHAAGYSHGDAHGSN
ncbi:hypothetical protein SEPCBS57363_006559, partial [Sporothrix epigloea]